MRVSKEELFARAKKIFGTFYEDWSNHSYRDKLRAES